MVQTRAQRLELQIGHARADSGALILGQGRHHGDDPVKIDIALEAAAGGAFIGQQQHQVPAQPTQPVQPAPQSAAQDVARLPVPGSQLPIAPLATSAAGSAGVGGVGGGGVLSQTQPSLGGPSTLLTQLAHSNPTPKSATGTGSIHFGDVGLLQGELFRGSGQQTSVGPVESEGKEPSRKPRSRKRSESSEGQAKKPLTDYQAFMQEEYKRLREEHPEVHPRELFGRAAKAVSHEEGGDVTVPGRGKGGSERETSGKGGKGKPPGRDGDGDNDDNESEPEQGQEEVPGMLTTTTPTSPRLQRTTSPQTPLSTLLRDSLREEGEGGRRDLGLSSVLDEGVLAERGGDGGEEQGGVLATPKKGALGTLGALGRGGEGGGEGGEGEMAVGWPAAEPPTGETRDGR